MMYQVATITQENDLLGENWKQHLPVPQTLIFEGSQQTILLAENCWCGWKINEQQLKYRTENQEVFPDDEN